MLPEFVGVQCTYVWLSTNFINLIKLICIFFQNNATHKVKIQSGHYFCMAYLEQLKYQSIFIANFFFYSLKLIWIKKIAKLGGYNAQYCIKDVLLCHLNLLMVDYRASRICDKKSLLKTSHSTTLKFVRHSVRPLKISCLLVYFIWIP